MNPLPWDERARDVDDPFRRKFIESYLGNVRAIALRTSSRLPPSVDPDDLIQEGVVGLIAAIDRYDPARGVPFERFADRRIQGSILDDLRRRDWRPRSLRTKQRQLDGALIALRSRLQRHPTEQELAQALDLDIDGYRQMLVGLAQGSTFSLDDLSPADHGSVAQDEDERPDAVSEHRDMLESVAEEIAVLPERELRVIQLYYFSQLNMKEIGSVLGVTESRICQLHSQAASRLRSAMRQRLSAEPAVPAVRAERSGR